MDPLSITVSVLSLVSCSITTIQTCQRYASKYQDAELSMTSLRTECSAINLALLQIQRLITRDQRRNLKDRFEGYVLVEYESVLTGCQLVFTTFIAHASELGLDKEDNLKRATFWEKVRYVWNEPQMVSLRGVISGQANAVEILLSVFQAESSDKAYSLMRNNIAKTSFRRVANDTASLIRSLSVSNISSRHISIYEGTIDSLLGDEDFSFDPIVLDSATYRRAFARQQSRNQSENSNDATTATPDTAKAAISIISTDTGVTIPAEATPWSENKSDGLRQSEKPPRLRTPIYEQFMARPSFPDTPLETSTTGLEQLPFFKDYYSQDDIYPGGKVSALWEYMPRAGDEFTLERGDMLEVVALWNDGWATGIMIKDKALEWDAHREEKANGSSTVVSGEIMAFPLVCVCMPDHWRSFFLHPEPPSSNERSEPDSDNI